MHSVPGRACGRDLPSQHQGPLCCLRAPLSPMSWQFLCLSPTSESSVTHTEVQPGSLGPRASCLSLESRCQTGSGCSVLICYVDE